MQRGTRPAVKWFPPLTRSKSLQFNTTLEHLKTKLKPPSFISRTDIGSLDYLNEIQKYITSKKTNKVRNSLL